MSANPTLNNENGENQSLPISQVVFFELVKGKYLASNGVEVTTEFILKHEHCIFHYGGYVIIKRA